MENGLLKFCLSRNEKAATFFFSANYRPGTVPGALMCHFVLYSWQSYRVGIIQRSGMKFREENYLPKTTFSLNGRARIRIQSVLMLV